MGSSDFIAHALKAAGDKYCPSVHVAIVSLSFVSMHTRWVTRDVSASGTPREQLTGTTPIGRRPPAKADCGCSLRSAFPLG